VERIDKLLNELKEIKQRIKDCEVEKKEKIREIETCSPYHPGDPVFYKHYGGEKSGVIAQAVYYQFGEKSEFEYYVFPLKEDGTPSKKRHRAFAREVRKR